MAEWKRVRLGEVVRHRKEFTTIDDLIEYKRCRVQVRAQGVVLRDTVPGSLIKTKRQQVCRAGDFLVAEIDAKMGGFGLVPDVLDGAVVSSHYFLFEVDGTYLDRDFLDLYSKTPEFMEQVSAQGSTNYAAIRPSHVSDYTLPLPPLPEQQRIVARVEAMLAKVGEARDLRAQNDTHFEEFQAARNSSIFSALSQTYPVRSLGELANHITSGPRDWGGNYTEAGWRFYRAQDLTRVGRISEDKKAFIDQSNDRSSAKLAAGDLLIVITGATVGRCALFTDFNESGYISQHVALCRLEQSIIEPEFAHLALLSPFGQTQLLGHRYGQGKPGLNLNQIRSLNVPVPPLNAQRQMVQNLRAQSKSAAALRQLNANVKVEVDALPASILARAFAGGL